MLYVCISHNLYWCKYWGWGRVYSAFHSHGCKRKNEWFELESRQKDYSQQYFIEGWGGGLQCVSKTERTEKRIGDFIWTLFWRPPKSIRTGFYRIFLHPCHSHTTFWAPQKKIHMECFNGIPAKKMNHAVYGGCVGVYNAFQTETIRRKSPTDCC